MRTIDALIEQQWADDDEYLNTCTFLGMNLHEAWEVEARLRVDGPFPPFLVKKLEEEWSEVFLIAASNGGTEIVLRRVQPLIVDAVKPMTASLLRLANTYNLSWLNWCEFDGHIRRYLHRQLDNWTWDPAIARPLQ